MKKRERHEISDIIQISVWHDTLLQYYRGFYLAIEICIATLMLAIYSMTYAGGIIVRELLILFSISVIRFVFSYLFIEIVKNKGKDVDYWQSRIFRREKIEMKSLDRECELFIISRNASSEKHRWPLNKLYTSDHTSYMNKNNINTRKIINIYVFRLITICWLSALLSIILDYSKLI